MTSSSQQCSVSEYLKPWLLADLMGSEILSNMSDFKRRWSFKEERIALDTVLLVPVLLHFLDTFQYS